MHFLLHDTQVTDKALGPLVVYSCVEKDSTDLYMKATFVFQLSGENAITPSISAV
jgi:hypothetical protein